MYKVALILPFGGKIECYGVYKIIPQNLNF